MKPNILIRADGSSQIGHGHLIRCMALAGMLKDSFKITFICKEIPEQNKTDIENEFELIKINTEEDFFKKIASNTIVVLDGYDFDTAYQKKIKSVGCKLVCIDDLHDKKFVADLIINHAPGVKPADYEAQSYTKFALGLKYALLRPEFLKQTKKERTIQNIETVLICFGGADPTNFTEKIFSCIKDEQSIKKIVLVIGTSYTQVEDLKNSIANYKHIELLINIDAKGLANIMSKTDLAIVPSSTIGLEALVSNMILITGMTADNQQNIYDGLLKENTVIGIGNFNQLTCTSLLDKITKASKKYSNYSFNLKNNQNNPLEDLFKSLLI